MNIASRTRGARSDRGVVILEAALVSLLVFLLLFGTIEFGLVYRDYLTVGDAAGSGARQGSVMGKKVTSTGTNADYEIIKAVREATAGINPDDIERIVIFKGTPGGGGSPTSQIPLACRNGTPLSGRCNVFEPTLAFLEIQNGNAAYFDCAQTPASPSCSWPPSTRKDGPAPPDVEYIGVWIRVKHAAITGLFGAVFVLEDATVSRLEAGVFDGS